MAVRILHHFSRRFVRCSRRFRAIRPPAEAREAAIEAAAPLREALESLADPSMWVEEWIGNERLPVWKGIPADVQEFARRALAAKPAPEEEVPNG